jgi:ABC-type Zn2+ transport system substrate-binding protein/surface adhesin
MASQREEIDRISRE